MIITDLEHLEFMAQNQRIPNYSPFGGQGFIVHNPWINLSGVVKASSTPSTLSMVFSGSVIASDYAYLNVIQAGYVYAMSPV
ncbi:hypothetical protein [Microcystis aeruginosa]|uniref:Uncharacterized protein n=1 Tax=Microcystis aeruginosa NIES-3807 TaxID=2517785 RepID=A0AAD3B3P9_MICAE|nr:hypothetical protein [Microcystis aeruginosa]GCL60640.1 hypothetical protein NIES3807_38250 [Microcystis aeruginosa NIES-3807]